MLNSQDHIADVATQRVTQHLGAGVDGVQTSTPSERFITAIFWR